MRPIDADALVDQLSDKAKEMLGIAEQCQGLAINYYRGAKYGFAKAAIIANGLPTIEPKRGKWITKKDACGIDYQICSNCETEIQWRNRHGVILRVDMQSVPYCPNCGAKMEVEE